MTQTHSSDVGAKLILRGIHLSLTDAMKAAIEAKVERLLRHEPRIDRVRIDVDTSEQRTSTAMFTAKGHIEIGGPDLIASVATEDAYKSIDLLVDKLDRQLRKRATARQSKRHNADLRAFVAT